MDPSWNSVDATAAGLSFLGSGQADLLARLELVALDAFVRVGKSVQRYSVGTGNAPACLACEIERQFMLSRINCELTYPSAQ